MISKIRSSFYQSSDFLIIRDIKYQSLTLVNLNNKCKILVTWYPFPKEHDSNTDLVLHTHKIHILAHAHRLLRESYCLGRTGGSRGSGRLTEQIGCQVKIESCALSNQLRTRHDCFLTNNTCGC